MEKSLILILALLVNGFALRADTILVRHSKDASPEEVKRFHESHGMKAKPFIHLKWSAVQVPDGHSKEMMETYGKSPLFDKVQPNRVYTIDTLPNDPLWSNQWGPQKIQAPAAWDIRTSNDVVVAVIDTGIDFNHEDLRDNLWTGPQGEHGYTAIGGSLTNGGMDDHLHGTHVAGTIGAIGNNAVGVAGLNWRCKLISFKFLDRTGSGESRDAALLIEKMVDLRAAGVNIRVSNNSWGGTGEDPLLQDAFELAEQAGILNICAAGNNAEDIDEFLFIPAGFTNNGIVSVLASDQADEKAVFSNYGLGGTDLLAPGVNILSCKLGGGYWELSGTSMASPHVAGVVAMMYAINPLPPALMKSVLLDPESLDRTDFVENTTFGGRLNMVKAISNPKLIDPSHVSTNLPPTLSLNPATNFIRLATGQRVTINATGMDPNNDPLLYVLRTSGNHQDNWLLESSFAGHLNRRGSTNTISLTNRPCAHDLAVNVRFIAVDGFGGSAIQSTTVFMERDASVVRDLAPYINGASLTPVGTNYYAVGLSVSTSNVLFSFEHSVENRGGGASCCFTTNDVQWIYATLPGLNSVRVRAMDNFGNFANAETIYFYVGPSSFTQVHAAVSFDKPLRGPAPFNFVADMRASTGGNSYQYFNAWPRGGCCPDVFFLEPVKRLSISEPGLHVLEFRTWDYTNGFVDSLVHLVDVLPLGDAPPPPPPPPPVNLVPPQDLRASLTGQTIALAWSNTATGEDSYNIEHRTKAKGPWTSFRLLASLAADSASFSFIASRNTQYEFRLRACKNSACGPYSNTASIRVR